MAHILVVDDDPDFVKATATVLKSIGHDVATARDGKNAISIMKKDKPDLVLLDVMMSYLLDGYDVAKEMSQSEELKRIPVLMVSSLLSQEYAEMVPNDQVAAVAVDGWLSKPVASEKLLKRVDQLVK